MEYVIEMDSNHQLTIPLAIVSELALQPGSHFTARLDAGRLIIERLPFSSQEQGKAINQTVKSLQK